MCSITCSIDYTIDIYVISCFQILDFFLSDASNAATHCIFQRCFKVGWAMKPIPHEVFPIGLARYSAA